MRAITEKNYITEPILTTAEGNIVYGNKHLTAINIPKINT
jgi:hypothetical protein